MAYERPNIAKLAPYTPGEQPTGRRARVIKLNTNENPYPPSKAVLAAIRKVTGESLRRYPPPLAPGFRAVAAKAHGLTPQNIIATNGGDELLRMAITVFCAPMPASSGGGGGGEGGGEGEGGSGAEGVGVAEPSYSLIPVLARIHDTPIVRIAMAEDFAVPDDFVEQLNEANCALAMIVNPHAPSGRLEPLAKLEHVAKNFRGVLMIDEAYVDFAQGDALPLVKAGLPNVLLLRSLSKGYSLAGLRFGYGIGHPDLVTALDKARDSYNTDVLAQAAATAALTHRKDAGKTWKRVIAERTRLMRELVRRGFTVLPSQSNFLLATPPASRPARAIYHALKAKNIFVRYFDQDRLRDKLRITVGTPAQDNALLAAIDKL